MRRSEFNASRRRVRSFSLARSPLRAVTHSSRHTTFGGLATSAASHHGLSPRRSSPLHPRQPPPTASVLRTAQMAPAAASDTPVHPPPPGAQAAVAILPPLFVAGGGGTTSKALFAAQAEAAL